jgi:nucleoside-triphosphatase
MPAILVTGPPGCGKTTLIRGVVEALRQEGHEPGGFITEERRDARGARTGFDIVTLDGRRARLAVLARDLPGAPRVGRYAVDVASLESVAVPALAAAIDSGRLVVIDEIGKMELLSPALQRAVIEAFRRNRCLLGTITQRPHPFADELKTQPDVSLLAMTREDREEVYHMALMLTRACLGGLSV